MYPRILPSLITCHANEACLRCPTIRARILSADVREITCARERLPYTKTCIKRLLFIHIVFLTLTATAGEDCSGLIDTVLHVLKIFVTGVDLENDRALLFVAGESSASTTEGEHFRGVLSAASACTAVSRTLYTSPRCPICSFNSSSFSCSSFFSHNPFKTGTAQSTVSRISCSTSHP